MIPEIAEFQAWLDPNLGKKLNLIVIKLKLANSFPSGKCRKIQRWISIWKGHGKKFGNSETQISHLNSWHACAMTPFAMRLIVNYIFRVPWFQFVIAHVVQVSKTGHTTLVSYKICPQTLNSFLLKLKRRNDKWNWCRCFTSAFLQSFDFQSRYHPTKFLTTFQEKF